MNEEQFYYTIEIATQKAVELSRDTVTIKKVSDFANQVSEGYDNFGLCTFRIYRTFDTKIKSCFQLRFPDRSN